jgi:hypothetical protein
MLQFRQEGMKKALRMLLYAVLGLTVLLLGIVAFWYVQVQNVEIARYSVIETDGDIEIRDYPAMIVAEVTRGGSRDQAVRAGFGPLAGYIFAKERDGEKIAMTAPVTQKAEGSAWTIRFVMPSGYDLERLPKPADPHVQLQQLPPARRAAIRFSGWWSDELFQTKDAALREWMAKRQLKPSGTPTFAYYNDPFTPGFLRRNEILYDLE